MLVIVASAQGNAAGGGDVTPAAIDFNNLSVTNTSGIETTNEVTFTGINSPINVRAKWTSSSGSPTKAQWLKNSSAVQSPQLTSIDATIINNDKLKWQTYCAYTHPSGNYDSGTVRVTNESRAATATMTIATPAVVTKSAHGLSAGDKVLFRTTGALPTGVTAETVYFVIATGLTADDFQFSATDGGAAINTSGSQSGTHTLVPVLDTFTYVCQYVRTSGGGIGGGDGDGDEGGAPEPPDFPSG
jgi:hypothetical protein